MGKSKKKGKGRGGGGGGEGEKKLGTRKRLQLERRQREENEHKADEAIVAGLKKLAERGITVDSDLFAPILPNEDCPVCMVPLPVDEDETTCMDCCGKLICMACNDACVKAQTEVNAARETKKQPPLPYPCAFCRTEIWKAEEEYLDRMMKQVESKDSNAMFTLAGRYWDGQEGVEKDEQKAFDLILRAVELGNMRAFNNLAVHYLNGENLQSDLRKCRTCMEASARAGYFRSHFNLGNLEYNNGNYALAVKHYRVAAGAGYKPALDEIQNMHQEKKASHGEFNCAIEAYKKAKEDQSSEERTKWAEQKKKEANESGNTTA